MKLKPAETIVKQIPRAFLVSIAAAVTDVSLYAMLHKSIELHPMMAATISYLTGGLIQWFGCSRWVFKDKRKKEEKNKFTGIIHFYILSLGGLAITLGVIFILYNKMNINYLLAKFAALGLAFAWNFLSRKFLIFERQQPIN